MVWLDSVGVDTLEEPGWQLFTGEVGDDLGGPGQEPGGRPAESRPRGCLAPGFTHLARLVDHRMPVPFELVSNHQLGVAWPGFAGRDAVGRGHPEFLLGGGRGEAPGEAL